MNRLLRLMLACTACAASSCAAPGATVATAAVNSAIINTAIAGTAAAVSRANGGCFSGEACPPGTLCNRQTGYCDRLPCDGKCTPEQMCDQNRCINMPDLSVGKQK